MANMSGIRGELTRAIRKEHKMLTAINLHIESQHNNVPAKWLLDNLDGMPATSLLGADDEESVRFSPAYATLNGLGAMHYTLTKGFSKDQLVGIGAGSGYLIKPNRHTKKHRFMTLRELLRNQVCPKPEYPKERKLTTPVNLGTRFAPIYEVDADHIIASPESLATREQLNPLANNAYYMIYTDLQTFRTALANWLTKTAPRRYAQQIANTK
jgi:hypothetical protein